MKYIGVTGTNGKTSTVQFIYQMLTGMGRKAAVCGTLGLRYDGKCFDTGLTTPARNTLQFHIANMESVGVEYLVMEVSSHSLVQNRVQGIEFDVGIFTNLTQEHLDYHGDFKSYKEAKRKILSMSKNMVINIDDIAGEEFFHEFYKDYEAKIGEDGFEGECITLTTACDCADVVATRIDSSLQGTEFLCDFLGTKAQVKIPVLGKFSVYNVMSAMAALRLLGFDFEDILAALHSIEPVSGRAQILKLDQNFTVMIDYAHTPDALENLLSAMRDTHNGRIVTLFGCGGDRDREKRPVMGEVVTNFSDYIYVTSDNPRTEDPVQIVTDILPAVCRSGKPYRVIINREEAIETAVRNSLPGDLLILAGKGHEKYQIVGEEKNPFDEEKIVRKALNF